MMLIRRELLGAAGASGPSDPYFENVTLLLHGDGTNGGQNNTFVDSSTNNFTITRNGNTTQGSFSPYGSLWSNYLDGNGDYLSVASNAVFGMGTGDFTLECWVFVSAYNGTGSVLIDLRSGTEPSVKPDLEFSSTGVLGYRVNGATRITGGTLPLNTWCHVALARSGTTTKMFLNGTQTGSDYTDTNNYGTTSECRIGADDDGSANAYLNGYISNVRILKGTALYTSNFTPPTAPLTAITNTSLLTCQSNRFVDNSSNNFTITRNGDVSVQRFSPFSPSSAYSTATIGASGYFDGTGDYLTAASNSAFSFGTGDFTVEAWIYPTQTGRGIWSNGPTSAGSFGIEITAGNVLRCDYYGGTGLAGATTIRTNTWNHIAVTRSGSTLSLYLNGSRDATTTTSSNNTSSDMAVGRTWTNYSSADWFGFISNLRVIKGQALYTGTTYTVPNAPLTTTGYGSTSQSITGTVSLLLNFTNASIFDNAMMADLETVGNAQIDTTVKKFGTGSLEFDGSGDYLVAPSNPAFAFGTGDFTIEFWVYVSGTSAGQILFDQRTSASQIVPTVYIETNTIYYFVNGSSRISAGFTTTNSWVHIAVARAGTSTKMFVNGTQAGSTYTDSNNYIQNPVYVGARWDATASVNGYIDDLRITKGVARYTANFTPPTAAFPNK